MAERKKPVKTKITIKKRRKPDEKRRPETRNIHAVKNPFPKENQLWQLRAKHGRDRLFNNAEELWQAALEYFEYIDGNPIIKIDFRGPYNDQVNIPLQRPYTIQGLCLYLDCNVGYFNDFEYQLANKKKENWSEKDRDFSVILARIRQTIYSQKLDGAVAGIFNPVVISRDLGLIDRTQTDLQGEVTVKQITGMIIMQTDKITDNRIEDIDIVQDQLPGIDPLLNNGVPINESSKVDSNGIGAQDEEYTDTKGSELSQ